MKLQPPAKQETVNLTGCRQIYRSLRLTGNARRDRLERRRTTSAQASSLLPYSAAVAMKQNKHLHRRTY
ncbi:hypothetical protein [Oscillatoria sp. FACHB-1406]|uniref:hypothetical protein n=1 Tax=Oscillatoria sp. FACHB-1406 TaxID=2692846 RepID=UPI00168464C6|nr:hypothetical protein [Oscillatoria sp. FACHB-1406]MBD2577110.1 hypothetical protein [Oscillatoria sp. FACHB-1406]